jgi:hypothetical protein
MATSQISILLIIIIDRLLICEIGEIRQHNAVAIVCDTVLPGLSIHYAVDSIDLNGRIRKPMPPGEYTSLFFLDEATALAAGHRPCYQCSWEKANAFAEHWTAANPMRGVAEQAGDHRVDHIDEQLHRERITHAYYLRDRRKRVYLESIDDLPDGTFVALGGNLAPFLVRGPRLFPWSTQGYGAPITRPAGNSVVVLTPSSTVRALAHGYVPGMHPSAMALGGAALL